MKILVTGGAGFIGSNLCEALLAQAHEVVCLDNFITSSKRNLDLCLASPKFTLIEGDIRHLSDCNLAMAGCEAVVHLAALGSVPRSIHDPITSNSINIDGFLHVIHTAKELGIKRFVFAASSSTYGDSASLPKQENIIGNPLSPYAVGKYVNELYAHVYHLNYNLPYIGLRYFNVFGRRQDPNGAYAAVIPKFIHHCLHEESPVINGDGSNTRDFTHIDNVVEGTIKALMNDNPDAQNKIYNLAYGASTSLNELVTLIREAVQYRKPTIQLKEVLHGPYRKGDIPHSLASIEKIQRFLGYQPAVSVREGIQKTVDYMMGLEA
ncbi:MAG: SDR family oxidoreductase [Flavobacteriia bacterium]|nr:SDR family oxidoreductase [Flavobacteriia bacterium]